MISNQKFVDWDGLVYYDGKIKKYVDDNVANCIKFGGLVSFNTLPRPSYQNLNYTYTVTDSFKSNEFFVEPGLTYARNTTVQVVEVNGMYLYSVFRENEVDLSAINYNIAVLQQESEKSSAAIRELESDLKDQSDKLDRALGSMTDTNGGIEELSKTVNQMDELLDGLHESVVKLDGRVDDLYAAQTTISNNLIDVREAVCEKADKSDLEGLASEEFVARAISAIEVPAAPTKVSELENDAGYITAEDLPTDYVKEIPDEYVTEEELNSKGYLTEHQDLGEYAKTSEVDTKIAAIQIPEVPEKVSELENDAGYITINDIDVLASTTEVYALNLTGLDSFSALTPEQDKIVSALYDTDTTDSERRPSVITYVKDTQLNTNWVLVNTVNTHLDSGLGYITLQTAPLLKNSDESVSVEYYEFTFRKLNSAAAEWIFYNAKRVTTDNLATVDELNTLANRIDTIVVPEIDLSNYYNKTEVENIVDEAVGHIKVPEVPTNVSAFVNDAGYITEHQDLSAYALKSDIPSIDGLASEEYVQLKVAEAQLGGSDGNVDLSVFVTQEQLEKELTEVTTTLEQSIKYGEF